ncbi:NERD domain-containing protein [Alkalibacillus aidingensis]|uniref:NERD domain-containing protein n=1 Tax=Alkalibacillus aidingensis TaxID=2747607 RepID=UPI0016617469|nr:NERD domain-containing protein [Alkalibacillus aidingensis]
MIYKKRTQSKELTILKSLDNRMELPTNYKQNFLNLLKGYEGEVKFDSLTEKLQCDCLILNDLLFNTNNTTFQIDSLMITLKTLYLFEVKNFEGDYYYENDKFFKRNNYEILNPLHQLSRCKSLFSQLLYKQKIDFFIQANVVFINPEFMLYQSPKGQPMIFPPQINRYLSKFNSISSKLNKHHKRIADELISLQTTENPYNNLPPYEYRHLRKGIICPKCNSFSIVHEKIQSICEECGHKEKTSTAVLRNVNELKLHFPEEKITTPIIYDWCNHQISERKIRTTLEKNYKKKGQKRWVYFE